MHLLINHCKVLFWATAFASLLSVESLPVAPAQQPSTGGSRAVITWSADLEGKNEAPAVASQAAAVAEFEFDFRKKEATVKIHARDLHDVSKILLGVQQVRGQLKVPAKVTLYDVSANGPMQPDYAAAASKDGALPLVYTRTFSGEAFQAVADAVLNGQGVVEVLTKAHPNGELVGMVQMHKSYK